jgi:anti-sigma factor RsiW
MAETYSDQQLQAFLDEALPAEVMSAVEVQLRRDAELRQRLTELAGRREAGVHTLGEIWRRHRLSCPTRQQLGNYLLGTLDEQWQDYVGFHLNEVGCRLCAANVADLRAEQLELQSAAEAAHSSQAARRRKYFQSSAGYLHREPPQR